MFLFKAILISKKLKWLLVGKQNKELNFYFHKFTKYLNCEKFNEALFNSLVKSEQRYNQDKIKLSIMVIISILSSIIIKNKKHFYMNLLNRPEKHINKHINKVELVKEQFSMN